MGSHDFVGSTSFEEHAQNGARREVPGSIGGARRTLCASKELAQNGARSGGGHRIAMNFIVVTVNQLVLASRFLAPALANCPACKVARL
jgi:hypothetical protein